MNRTRETVRQALNFLAEKARVTDDELGQMLGKSRQTGWAKRHGASSITWDDFDMLVLGFEVDKTVFLMEEPDLEKWYARTRWTGPKRPIVAIDLRDQDDRGFRCNDVEQLDLFSLTPQAADVRAGGVIWEFSDRSSVDTSMSEEVAGRLREKLLVA